MNSPARVRSINRSQRHAPDFISKHTAVAQDFLLCFQVQQRMATNPTHFHHSRQSQQQHHSLPQSLHQPQPPPSSAYQEQPHSIPETSAKHRGVGGGGGGGGGEVISRTHRATGTVGVQTRPTSLGSYPSSSSNHSEGISSVRNPSATGQPASSIRTTRASTLPSGHSPTFQQRPRDHSSGRQLPSSKVGEVIHTNTDSHGRRVVSDDHHSVPVTQDYHSPLVGVYGEDPQKYHQPGDRSYPQEQTDFRARDSRGQLVSQSRRHPQGVERLDSEEVSSAISKHKHGFSFNQELSEEHHHQQQGLQPQQRGLQELQELPGQGDHQLQHLQAYQPSQVPRQQTSVSTGLVTSSKTSPSVQSSSSAAQAMGDTVSRVTSGAFQRSTSSPYSIQQPKNCSTATLENERYQLDSFAIRDHENEDRSFTIDGGSFQAFGVFDGHDGCKAAGFASNYMAEMFSTQSWRNIMNSIEQIPVMMEELFLAADRDFFTSIDRHIKERKRLQDRIPQGMTSYEAYQLFPSEVTRMQSLEPKISGGCTAVLAVICNNHLFVANTGDSRALLIREEAGTGALVAEQLSVDHTIESEDELQRLEKLGLPRDQLLKAGRLGTQENTRSIGDYYIKAGYKNVDSLRAAKSVPGLAQPYVMPPKKLDRSCRYLILMTDGVYKSIEDGFKDHNVIESNKVLMATINHSLKNNNWRMDTISDLVLSRIRRIHSDTYTNNAQIDVRSPLAVACRKRDDMTLTMYEIPHTENP